MNKVILGLILAVCVLGMALMMLNERLGRKSEPAPVAVAENAPEYRQPANGEFAATEPPAIPDTPPLPEAPAIEKPDSPAFSQPLDAARLEREDAEAALAPPQPQAEESAPAPEIAPMAKEPAPVVKAPLKAEQKNEVKSAPKAGTPGKEQRPEAKKENAAGRSITRFVVFSRDKGATVRITGNRHLNYKSMTLVDPDRVVIDLDGHWDFPSPPGVPKNDLVNNVRVGKSGDKTRVVIDLKEKPRSVRVLPAKGSDGFDVRVDK